MLIRNIKEFLKVTLNKKLICLDIGKKKIGIAISDHNHSLSFPLEVLIRNKEFLDKIKNIINNYSVGGIIVGQPLNEDGKVTRMSQTVSDITKNIEQFLLKYNIDLPIFFWDESYTSLEAEDITKFLFKNYKHQKKNLDKFAAKVILDDFLRECLNSNEKENK